MPIRERLTNKEIALRLNLSEQTVKNHVHHTLRKMGVANRFAVLEICEAQIGHSSMEVAARVS